MSFEKTPTKPRTFRRPWLLFGLLAVLAFVAVGCGGSDSGGGSNPLGGFGADASPPAAAELLPADVPILMTLNTDLDSEQWQLATDIAARFPASQSAIDEALKELGAEGLDFETDIRPALGTDVTLAILELTEDDPPIAVLLQPTDSTKLDELLTMNQADDPDNAPAWRVVDDWYVLGDDEASIDALLAAADQGTLADAPEFGEVMGSLPEDSLVRMWISPTVVDELVAQTAADNPDGVEALQSALNLSGSFEGGGVAMLASEEGVKMVGLSKTVNAPVPNTGVSEIDGLAPPGVIAFASFRGLRDSIDQIVDLALQSEPSFESQLGQAEALLGLTIEDDLLPLFENEHAVYLRPGAPIPEITVVLSPDDPDKGTALVERLLQLAPAAGVPLQSSEIDIAGRKTQTIALDGVSLFFAQIDDRLVITTSEAGIADFASGESFRDDAKFVAARAAVGLPDETAGYLYVDTKEILDLVLGLRGLDMVGDEDVDAEALANIEPLGPIIAYGSASENEQRFAALLTIE